jgi:glycosyltransferase involved in cell wall biosynthesis
VTTVPNGVEPRAAGRANGTRPVLAFTGAMDYWPNVDAATCLVREILPRVRAAMPAAEAIIVGQRPTPAVRRLGRVLGVTVTGPVPDVEPYLRAAAIFVAPLRVARGVQNKVLEAMAVGLPVVCSSEAAAGIAAVPGRDLVVADGPGPMAAAAVDLLQDPTRRQRLGAAARELVATRHRWDAHLDVLEQILLKSACAAGQRSGAPAA